MKITKDLYNLSTEKLKELVKGVVVIDEATGKEKGYSRVPSLEAIKYVRKTYEEQQPEPIEITRTWSPGKQDPRTIEGQ